MNKPLQVLLLAFMLVLISPLLAFAGTIVLIDGTPLSAQDEPAFVSGKLMVPMRVIFEKLGANVSWNNGVIDAAMGSTQIKLKINSLHGQLNNRPHILPVAPTMINNKTMVPLRFVGETLNADVDYLHEHQLVLITSDVCKKALNSNNFEVKKRAEKYNAYKNTTITNEKAVALYRSNKQSIINQIKVLQAYEDKISADISTKDISIFQEAAIDYPKLLSIQKDITNINFLLKSHALTNKLSYDYQNYCDYIVFSYRLLAEEREFSSTLQDKVKKIQEMRVTLLSTINEIESKNAENISEARQGI